MKRGLNRRGISPVIATVLLVGIVIVIALIVFMWIRGIQKETCTKFDGRNVDLVCGDVDFMADCTNGNLQISNNGNIPIFSLKVKVVKGGSYETFDVATISTWPGIGLNTGGTFSADISSYILGAETIFVTPVLMASCQDEGEKAYTCNENAYSKEIGIF